MKTLRLKVKPDSYNWLNKAAIEINQVWNWADSPEFAAIEKSMNSMLPKPKEKGSSRNKFMDDPEWVTESR